MVPFHYSTIHNVMKGGKVRGKVLLEGRPRGYPRSRLGFILLWCNMILFELFVGGLVVILVLLIVDVESNLV